MSSDDEDQFKVEAKRRFDQLTVRASELREELEKVSSQRFHLGQYLGIPASAPVSPYRQALAEALRGTSDQPMMGLGFFGPLPPPGTRATKPVGLLDPAPPSPEPLPEPDATSTKRRTGPRGVKATTAIEIIMEAGGGGADLDEIIDQAAKRGVQLIRPSLRSQLSKMESVHGIIENRGSRYFFTAGRLSEAERLAAVDAVNREDEDV